MSKTSENDNNTDNVIDLFTRKPIAEHEGERIIRISPELDDIEILYSNDANPGKIFSMKILCWALRSDGSVDAMVPWLNKLVGARELDDPLNGHWEGYFDRFHHHAFFEPPQHKISELETTATYYRPETDNPDLVVQEISDHIGTHAVMTEDGFQTILLIHITSWRLFNDGRIHAMLADEKKIITTPILPKDDCLFAAQEHEHFKYFFHYLIANKIKQGDEEAIAALSHILEEG